MSGRVEFHVKLGGFMIGDGRGVSGSLSAQPGSVTVRAARCERRIYRGRRPRHCRQERGRSLRGCGFQERDACTRCPRWRCMNLLHPHHIGAAKIDPKASTTEASRFWRGA
jgi:hypothetical protein